MGPGKPTFFTLLTGVPDEGAKLDMYAFGFTSNMLTAGSLDIRESASKLHEYLQFARVLDYPTVVFVAQSMGGLIVLRELINHREMMEKVPLVVLFATPQAGAQIADPSLYGWSDDTPREISGGNTQLMQMSPGFGANADAYPFVLQSDASPDQRVIVRVADLAAFRKKQRDFAEAVNKDVSAYLANPGNAAQSGQANVFA